MPEKPKTVVLCGSSRFVEIIAVVGWILERDEGAVVLSMHLLPRWYGAASHHQAESEGVAAAMDLLHLRKIDLADEVFVVDAEGYIGESCTNEIAYAHAQGKPLRFYTGDHVGDLVEDLKEQFFGDRESG